MGDLFARRQSRNAHLVAIFRSGFEHSARQSLR